MEGNYTSNDNIEPGMEDQIASLLREAISGEALQELLPNDICRELGESGDGPDPQIELPECLTHESYMNEGKEVQHPEANYENYRTYIQVRIFLSQRAIQGRSITCGVIIRVIPLRMATITFIFIQPGSPPLVFRP